MQLVNGSWLIAGGYDTILFETIDSTENLMKDIFVSGPSLPEKVERMCLATLDDNTLFMAGGYPGTGIDKL
jgi:methionine synthase I (cobalamin-dependent)